MKRKKRGLQKERRNFFRRKLVLETMKSKIFFSLIVLLFGVVIVLG